MSKNVIVPKSSYSQKSKNVDVSTYSKVPRHFHRFQDMNFEFEDKSMCFQSSCTITK